MDKDSSSLYDKETKEFFNSAETILDLFSEPKPLDEIIKPYSIYSAYNTAILSTKKFQCFIC